MKNRTAQYRRRMRQIKIDRKKQIIKDQNNYWHYTFEGALDKGKIHCSCWMCRRKSYDYARQDDERKAYSMLYDLEEEGFSGTKAEKHIKARTKFNS